jgi:hypothetical protein
MTMCRWCDSGDKPKVVDKNGVLCSVSGEAPDMIAHASDIYWWRCRNAPRKGSRAWVNITQQRHAAGAKATLPPDNAVCEHCLRSTEDECFGCQNGSKFLNAATSA